MDDNDENKSETMVIFTKVSERTKKWLDENVG